MADHPASSISGAKLLAMRQVLLLCFRSIDTSGNRKEALKETVKDVMIFWSMARIETICERSCEHKLEKHGVQMMLRTSKSKGKASAVKVDDFKKR